MNTRSHAGIAPACMSSAKRMKGNCTNGVLFGVFMNATKRKQAEETRELLAGEISFRVKNLFSIAA